MYVHQNIRVGAKCTSHTSGVSNNVYLMFIQQNKVCSAHDVTNHARSPHKIFSEHKENLRFEQQSVSDCAHESF